MQNKTILLRKGNNDDYIKIDKNIAQEFECISRPLSKVEAYVFFSIDFDNDTPHSIEGYANLWRWRTNEVKYFFKQLQHITSQTLLKKINKIKRPIQLVLSNSKKDSKTEERE